MNTAPQPFEQLPLSENESKHQDPESKMAHPLLGNACRSRGKVGRLPKIVRDQLNIMILDGVPYAEIIRRLGPDAKHLKPDHLHEWKKRGFKNWLVERNWLEHISSKAEFSADILAAPDSSGLHEAGLRIAASQMFDQLMRFTAASPESADAAGQPEIFARLVNALSRLTREALNFQKYRDASTKAAATKLKQLDPSRALTDNEFDLLTSKMDQIFKVARPTKPSPAPPSASAQPAASATISHVPEPNPVPSSPEGQHKAAA